MPTWRKPSAARPRRRRQELVRLRLLQPRGLRGRGLLRSGSGLRAVVVPAMCMPMVAVGMLVEVVVVVGGGRRLGSGACIVGHAGSEAVACRGGEGREGSRVSAVKGQAGG